MGIMSEGGQRIQTSIYKINVMGYNVHHGDYCIYFTIYKYWIIMHNYAYTGNI